MPMIDLTFVLGSLNDQALGVLTDELVTGAAARRTRPGHPIPTRQHPGLPAHAGSGSAVGRRSRRGRAPVPDRGNGV
jgi:hypothetical protein